MKEITWQGRLTRKTFRSWHIPPEIKNACEIEDGDRIDVIVEFGKEKKYGNFGVSSGGELLVRSEIAKLIKIYAESNPDSSVSFTMKVRPNALRDIEAAKEELKDLPKTQRQAIIEARIGQGLFRTRLLRAYDKKCAVTGVDVQTLLRASHIKPWRNSNNEERLSADNGLLLIANLDAAFDAQLISFTDAGRMLFHESLGPNPQLTLGIKENSELLKQPSYRQREFLAFHRALLQPQSA